jgi:hypothetical protein
MKHITRQCKDSSGMKYVGYIGYYIMRILMIYRDHAYYCRDREIVEVEMGLLG